MVLLFRISSSVASVLTALSSRLQTQNGFHKQLLIRNACSLQVARRNLIYRHWLRKYLPEKT